MPTTEDIRAAIALNDADEAERLMAVVMSKRAGRGLSGHDVQIFTADIARIRAQEPATEPERETVVDEPDLVITKAPSAKRRRK